GDGFFNPASRAFAALPLSACSLPSVDGDGFFSPARRAFATLRLSAYSLPSIGPTCGGSLSRYGRPIPSSFSCASIHFHKISLHVHLSARVSPFTLTRSAATPGPCPPGRLPPWYELSGAALLPFASSCR